MFVMTMNVDKALYNNMFKLTWNYLPLCVNTRSKLTIRDHSFSTYAEFSEKLTFLTPLIRTRILCVSGVRNVGFSKNFAYVLNE